MMWIGSLIAVLVCAGLALTVLVVSALIMNEQCAIKNFSHWVRENAAALESAPRHFHDVELNLNSVVVQFQVPVSMLVVTLVWRSRPHFAGHESVLAPALKYTLYSLLAGWWGLPWGPIRTLTALLINLRGGTRTQLRDIVADITGPVRSIFQLTPSAAHEVRRIIAERRFAPGTAMRIVPIDPPAGDFKVEYDSPENDGRDWQMQSEGVMILVDKSDVESWGLHDILVDFEDQRFTFRHP